LFIENVTKIIVLIAFIEIAKRVEIFKRNLSKTKLIKLRFFQNRIVKFLKPVSGHEVELFCIKLPAIGNQDVKLLKKKNKMIFKYVSKSKKRFYKR